MVKAMIEGAQKRDPQRTAMKLLLQDKLVQLCGKALQAQDGRISYDDLTLIHHMYESYHALGGNGDMEHLMCAVDGLTVYVEQQKGRTK